MTPNAFACYYATRDENKQVTAEVTERPLDELPDGDVLVRVAYSSLNYKDALSATGKPGVTRNYPHVPGIDAAGTVESTEGNRFRPGDPVVITGFDLGANTWGGFGQYVRVPEGWVVPLPEGLSLRASMIYGTAGFTAAIGLEALEAHGCVPGDGEVVVTGASGGVGSVGVAIMAKAGYRVVASTGKAKAHDFLRDLGASDVIGRDEVNDDSGRPLLSARWSGALDTVGGNTLATVIRAAREFACITCCGMVGGNELPITVFPFILRGAQLVGINSATYPIERRAALWKKLAAKWKPDDMESLVADTVGLAGLAEQIDRILAGGVRGRVVVEHET